MPVYARIESTIPGLMTCLVSIWREKPPPIQPALVSDESELYPKRDSRNLCLVIPQDIIRPLGYLTTWLGFMIASLVQVAHDNWGHWSTMLRKGLLLFLVLIHAFVLPFVCWGEVATPGHPHKMLHFVFAESAPLLWTGQKVLQEAASEGLCALTGVQHTASHHPAVPDAPDDAKPAENPPVAGRSVPSTILASLALLTSTQEPIVTHIGNLSSADAPAMPALSSIDISIPTPPPRLLSA